MERFVAIILICMKSVAPENCSEQTAADVMSIPADSELTCTSGWQDVVARSALAGTIGTESYVRTLCRRVAPKADREPSRQPAAGDVQR